MTIETSSMTIEPMTIDKNVANCPDTLLIRGGSLSRLRRQWAIRLGPAVAVELPHPPHFLNHVEIEIGDEHFIFAAAGLRKDLAARIAEVALAVKFSDLPRLLCPDAIDGAHEIS